MERAIDIDPGELMLERSALLASLPFVVHAATGRAPGLGRADGNLGYGGGRDREDAWTMRRTWCASAGVDPERIVTCGQVHGAHVIRVAAADSGRGARPESQIGIGDAMIANEPGPVLLSLHADCLPIFFADPGGAGRLPAIGVAHAGWRGTTAGVAPATVAAMAAAFGTAPGDLRVWLGPCIGGCCYEVGGDVVAAWRAIGGAEADAALRSGDGRTIFDLREANRLLLRRAGVPAEQIDVSAACTRCQPERWFSHRAQGPATGRFGAIIALRG
jgi:purine-nucleoside/S-methyl-5'-thioadenosine phosphorylase / adenosine deaminase